MTHLIDPNLINQNTAKPQLISDKDIVIPYASKTQSYKCEIWRTAYGDYYGIVTQGDVASMQQPPVIPALKEALHKINPKIELIQFWPANKTADHKPVFARCYPGDEYSKDELANMGLPVNSQLSSQIQ